MTIAAAWVRTLDGGAEELVFCSDSRLSGGNRFDHCQKIFRFARTDTVICFAGGTNWAYPMIVAAVKAADLHTPSRTRAHGLAKFKTHIVSLLDQMQREVHTYAPRQNEPDVVFLLGGYDWHAKEFRIWRISFDLTLRRFRADERANRLGFGRLGKIELAGDQEWVDDLRRRIKRLAQGRYGLPMNEPPSARFNLEPFEAIRDQLRDAVAISSIGGAPQTVKVYQYMNSADVGIFWPNRQEGRLFLSGRPLLDYERATINSVLCPDSLTSTWLSGNTQEAREHIARAAEATPGTGDDFDREGPEIEIHE